MQIEESVYSLFGWEEKDNPDSKLENITQIIIRKSKFPLNPERSVQISGKRTKRSVQKKAAHNTYKAGTKG